MIKEAVGEATGGRSKGAYPDEKRCHDLLIRLPSAHTPMPAHTTPPGMLTRKSGDDDAWRPSNGPPRESIGAGVALTVGPHHRWCIGGWASLIPRHGKELKLLSSLWLGMERAPFWTLPASKYGDYEDVYGARSINYGDWEPYDNSSKVSFWPKITALTVIMAISATW